MDKEKPMSNPTVPQPQSVQIRFVDRPEVTETFADSSRSVTFDGQTMRIEFCTIRMEEPKPPDPPVGRQYPVCRLVLTPNAAVDLFNKLQQIMTALEQSGAIKKNQPMTQVPPVVQ
jgi:hypothetical protein